MTRKSLLVFLAISFLADVASATSPDDQPQLEQAEKSADTVLQTTSSRCPAGQTWQCTKVEKRCEQYCSGPPSEGSNCTWKVRCWKECTEYDCR